MSPAQKDKIRVLPYYRYMPRPEIWILIFIVFVLVLGAMLKQQGGAVQITFGVGIAALIAFISLMGWAWSSGRRRSGAEEAEWLKYAMEKSIDGVLITSRDGKFIYANPAFHTLLSSVKKGPLGKIEALEDIADAIEVVQAQGGAIAFGQGWVDPGDFRRLIGIAAAGGRDYTNIALRSSSGHIEWRRVSVEPVSNDWKFGKVLWRIEDVTSYQEMELIRSQEQERTLELLDMLPAGVFVADREGLLLYINETLASWLGVQAEAVIGQPFNNYITKAEKNGRFTLHNTHGDLFSTFLIRSRKETSEGDVSYIRSLVLRDVPPLHAVDEVDAQTVQPVEANSEILNQSEPEFGLGGDRSVRWLFHEAPVAIALVNLEGEITECNRSFWKMLGRHKDVLIGSRFSDWISREDQKDTTEALSKVVRGSTRAINLEIRMPGAGENELVTSLYASRLEESGGEVSGVILHFIDTTEQKNLEVQFAQSQKMQAIGQLAGGVAHDFNNLLTAMIGFSDLLLMRHGPGDPDFNDLQQIRQNANRATNLVRQLLAFSRQDASLPTRLDITESLNDLSNLLRRLIGEKIELLLNHGQNMKSIFVDRGQLDQVIINLCVNARDAMPDGGSITLKTESMHFDEPVQRGHDLMPEGDYVRLQVSDTGSGISKEHVDRIFEPFFTTKGVGEGTGLGLSTVYGIVHQAGGYIFVDSALGEGTTFSIYLLEYTSDEAITTPIPIKTIGPKNRKPLPEDSDLTGRGTVLIVEDEEAVRLFGARALRNKGYTILEANNAEVGLEVINSTEEKIDLIISDVVMPGMDGHTFVSLVRKDNPKVKVILMSGYASDLRQEAIENDDQIEFLGKPFSLKDLAHKVKTVIES